MSTIAVLGLGNFGTALARNWLQAGHSIIGWTVEQEVHDSLKTSAVNAKYLPGVVMHGMQVTMSISEAVRCA